VTFQLPEKGVAYYLGKFLELNGLVLLGYGLFWGLIRDDIKGEIRLLGLGVAVFLGGYWLERRRSRRS
jgi:hypothetical protein